MTRARTLKSTIRARMAKTGERYTAARRHVLTTPDLPAPAPAPRPPAGAAATQVEAKGAASEARVLARTGHDLAHWFAVLDRFGAVQHGHTAAARHLREAHGVDAWYAQSITVLYERARGLRTVNQRVSGSFEFSASKIVNAPVSDVEALIAAQGRRRAWTASLDRELVATVTKALASPATAFAAKPKGVRRCRFRWADSVVEMYIAPYQTGRAKVEVIQTTLPSRASLDARRAAWRAWLAALAEALSRTPPTRRPRD